MNYLFLDKYRLTSITTFDQVMVVLLVLAFISSLVFSYQRIINRSAEFNTYKSYLHFLMVGVVNALAFISLLFQVLTIESLSEEKTTIILLTSGTTQQQIESLNVTINDNVYILPQYGEPFDLEQLKHQVTHLDNIESMSLNSENIDKIKVYGDGLFLNEWRYLPLTAREFFPSPKRTGVTELQWLKEISVGELFTVSGTFQTSHEEINKSYKLSLSDFNGEEVDSVDVLHGDKFSLVTHSKVIGLFNYQLNLLDDKEQVIKEENVAFEVKNNQSADIAIKQSAPSFETRHLKNWASDNGSEMLLLTQISQNNYMQQTANNSENSLEDNKGALAIDWLRKFDLLILDGRSFANLTKMEVNVLEQAVIEGIGLLILADDSLLTSLKNGGSQLLKGIQLADMVELKDTRVSIPLWLNSITPLQLVSAKYILSTNKGKVLVKGVEGENLVVSRQVALGKVAVSLLTQTYQWSISDNKIHYSQYWHYLVARLSRNKSQNYWHDEMNDEISYIGQNKVLCAQVEEQNKMTIFSEQVYLSKLVERNTLRCGHYWPEFSGWHNFTLKDNSQVVDKQSRFVYQTNDWLVWQQTQKNNISDKVTQQAIKPKQIKNYLVIDRTLFWLLFFLCVSCLWIEQKAFNR
ncbi:MAG: hypothetical protein MJK12_18850 [Colwellia sp.]|nr:hypothetical protein [Colwellia sp.]